MVGKRLVLADAHRLFGDAHRMVAHALQLVDDELDGDQLAQVARDGRLERHHADAAAADAALQLVDLAVAGDDLGGEDGVALAERLHRARDLALDERRHLNNRLFDLAQFLMKRLARHESCPSLSNRTATVNPKRPAVE